MSLRVALTHAHCWPEVRRGGERYLHELAASLSRRGHDVTIVAGASRNSVCEEDGVRIVRLRRSRRGDAIEVERRFAHKLESYLSDESFDIVHSLGAQDAAAAIRATPPSTRTVYTCLGIPDAAFIADRSDAADHQLVVDEVDVYGCLSAYAQSGLQKDFGRVGALTPGGVDVARFVPMQRTSEPTLLYSGALDELRKGVGTLLRAVAMLARSQPRIHLWLTGSGDPAKVMRSAPREAKDRTDVLGVGRLEDVPRRYATAWATVLASHHEAFGLVLVESLAAGTPIVAGDHAALPEIVEEGSGVLSPPDDPEALADACGRALALAADTSTAERCRAAAMRHDWDATVTPMIEALYEGGERDGSGPPLSTK